jgi:hypothetical protein
MNLIRWAPGSIASLMPVPREIGDASLVVDPRVDPDALEVFGRAQISQFGAGQDDEGGAPLPMHYATDRAAGACQAEPRAILSSGRALT